MIVKEESKVQSVVRGEDFSRGETLKRKVAFLYL